MKISNPGLVTRCREGENILVVYSGYPNNCTERIGKGRLAMRNHDHCALMTFPADTVIYLDQPTEEVADLCARRVCFARYPLIIHDYR